MSFSCEEDRNEAIAALDTPEPTSGPKLYDGLADELSRYEREDRPAVVAFMDSAERDVLRQLAAKPRWDGYVSSKTARDSLCRKGLACRWNGYNFLTRDGFAVVDALWGLRKFIET